MTIATVRAQSISHSLPSTGVRGDTGDGGAPRRASVMLAQKTQTSPEAQPERPAKSDRLQTTALAGERPEADWGRESW